MTHAFNQEIFNLNRVFLFVSNLSNEQCNANGNVTSYWLICVLSQSAYCSTAVRSNLSRNCTKIAKLLPQVQCQSSKGCCCITKETVNVCESSISGLLVFN